MPKRVDVEDYFARLEEYQRPHLKQLRQLSRATDPQAREQLAWNLPVYVRDQKGRLWMLQNFKHHCSLRFPPRFFTAHIEAVQAAGYEAGAGFIKLPYEHELPVELCRQLMAARIAEYEATGAGWSDN